jgi:hypothetical protein
MGAKTLLLDVTINFIPLHHTMEVPPLRTMETMEMSPLHTFLLEVLRGMISLDITCVNPPSGSVSPQPNPFLVKLLKNRIKKCKGCNRNFSRKVDGSPPDPPLNLVVSHEERHPFTDAQNVRRVSRPQNTYYHASLSCIRASNPSFVGCQLQVPADVKLSSVHKKYLREYFGCDL